MRLSLIKGKSKYSYRLLAATSVAVASLGPTVPLVALAQEPATRPAVSAAPPATQPVRENAPPVTTPPAAEIPGAVPGQVVLEETVVRAERGSYAVREAGTATKTDAPIIEVPQSIQVVPEQVIRDQQVIRPREALRNVSGVQTPQVFEGVNEVFAVRGFVIGDAVTESNQLKDGFQLRSTAQVETANLERIEVLKGPGSVLYGRGQPGGTINYVTRKPLAQPRFELSQQVGSYDFYRTVADATGPITADGEWSYRLVGVYEKADSFRDFVESERSFVAPSLAWRPNDDTQVLLSVELLHDYRIADQGLPTDPRSVYLLDPEAFYGVKDGTTENNEIDVLLSLDHRVSDAWTVRAALHGEFAERERDYAILRTPSGDTVRRTYRLRDDDSTLYEAIVDNVIKFDTDPAEHEVLVGLNAAHDTFDQERKVDTAYPGVNIFRPDNRHFAPNLTRDQDNVFPQDTFGLYVQDRISFREVPFGDSVHVLVGGRMDYFDYEFKDKLNDAETSFTELSFTPRAGVVYQPVKDLALFAGYSRSFTPARADFVIDRFGNPIAPETGEQYEAGVKLDLYDGRVAATAAVFHIEKEDVIGSDPDDFPINIGRQRSRGFEFDLAGELAPGWRVIASYAYTDTETLEDPFIPTGTPFVGVAPHSASLWTSYDVRGGPLRGLGGGVGAFFVDDRPADLTDTFRLPSYTTLDAGVWYQWENVRAQVNVRNLLDEDFIEGTTGFGIRPGHPVTVYAGLSVAF